MVVDGDIDCGHGGKERWAFFMDDLERRLQFETRQQDHLGAGMNAEIHHHRHGENVEYGQHAHHHFFAKIGFGEEISRLLHIVGEVGVGQHGALGPPGRAAGILQHCDIPVRVNIDSRRPAVVGG